MVAMQRRIKDHTPTAPARFRIDQGVNGVTAPGMTPSVCCHQLRLAEGQPAFRPDCACPGPTRSTLECRRSATASVSAPFLSLRKEVFRVPAGHVFLKVIAPLLNREKGRMIDGFMRNAQLIEPGQQRRAKRSAASCSGCPLSAPYRHQRPFMLAALTSSCIASLSQWLRAFSDRKKDFCVTMPACNAPGRSCI